MYLTLVLRPDCRMRIFCPKPLSIKVPSASSSLWLLIPALLEMAFCPSKIKTSVLVKYSVKVFRY